MTKDDPGVFLGNPLPDMQTCTGEVSLQGPTAGELPEDNEAVLAVRGIAQAIWRAESSFSAA